MDQTSYTDGLSAISELIVENLCNGYNYTSQGGSIDENAEEKVFYDDNMQHIGSDVRSTGFSGSLTCTYSSADHSLLTDAHRFRPGHVLEYRGQHYSVSAVKGAEAVRDVLRSQLTVRHLVCPVITSLLSASLGQGLAVTAASGGAYSKTNTVVNTRSGSTVAWSLVDQPSGMTINGSTGAISWATPVAGSYAIKVVATDTVAGKPDVAGFGLLNLTIT